MAEKRFVKLKNEGILEGATILVDRRTGVNYLFYAAGYAGGLTPLLDRDGKPVISALPLEE